MDTEERRKILLERKFILEKMDELCASVLAHLHQEDGARAARAARAKELSQRSRLISLSLRSLSNGCVIKTCTCGQKYPPSGWMSLSFVGYQSSLVVDGEVVGEMRNCNCKSTLLLITKKPNHAQP
jgi:hypothetical protein